MNWLLRHFKHEKTAACHGMCKELWIDPGIKFSSNLNYKQKIFSKIGWWLRGVVILSHHAQSTLCTSTWISDKYLAAISILRCRLTSIGVLKVRQSHDRLIFNMGIPIPGKDGLYFETGPRCLSQDCGTPSLMHQSLALSHRCLNQWWLIIHGAP